MPDFLPPAPPAPKRPSNWVIIASAAAVIAAVIGTGVFVVNSRGDDSKPATTTAASSAPDEDAAPAAEESDPEPTYADVDADSFDIELRTTERQCFGSAGCNVTIEPKLTYVGLSEELDPDAVYEITYEVRGDESGPVIETAELSDRTSLNYTPTSISTASSGTKVSVKITDVMTRGY
ncbi:hypothetical protein [Streptomyces hirsutus]|uniref:hypothetical protein n=1 Tax=Streptomyces hirsutus TaxID=35620 RepID=UPI0036463A66